MKISVIDTGFFKLDGGAMFGNAPKELWSRWVEPDERNHIDLACRCALIKEPNRRILLEAGIGAFFEPKLKDRFGVNQTEHVLLENLKLLGLIWIFTQRCQNSHNFNMSIFSSKM